MTVDNITTHINWSNLYNYKLAVANGPILIKVVFWTVRDGRLDFVCSLYGIYDWIMLPHISFSHYRCKRVLVILDGRIYRFSFGMGYTLYNSIMLESFHCKNYQIISLCECSLHIESFTEVWKIMLINAIRTASHVPQFCITRQKLLLFLL